MKVRIKTWEEMEKEFGIGLYDGSIKCERTFVTEMESALPDNRIIDVERIGGSTYSWIDYAGCEWEISDDMIAEYYNDYRKINTEMIHAMLEGAVLEVEWDGGTIHYDPEHIRGPFVWTSKKDPATTQRANEVWEYSARIQTSKTRRPMNRMERLGILTREGCVVRNDPDSEWEHSFYSSDSDTEYAILDSNGTIIDGPHRFVK
jgi:hypothetical protein